MNHLVIRSVQLYVMLRMSLLITSTPTPTTITSPPLSENNLIPEKDYLKTIFGHCLHKKDVPKCLKLRVIGVIDDVIQNDEPIQWNLFNLQMTLNKNPQFEGKSNDADSSRSFEDIITQKLKSLFESRFFQVKLANDSENHSDVPSDIDEARKKKGGGGKHHGMMMSGFYHSMPWLTRNF